MRHIRITVVLILFSITASAQFVEMLKRRVKTETEDSVKVQLLTQLFDHYRYINPDTALKYISSALEIAEEADIKKGIALSQLFLCETFSMIGNDPQALKYGFKALASFEELRDTMGICNTSTSIGNFYSSQNDFSKSLYYYHKALSLIENYSDQSSVHYFWGGISGIFLNMGHSDSALFYAEKAYKRDPGWTYGLILMASIKTLQGHNDEALDFYRKAELSALKNNLHNDLISIYSGIAKIQRKNQMPDSAVYFANKALAKIREHSFPSGYLELATMLSEIYEEKNESDSTIKYLKLASSIKDELNNTEKIRAFQNISFNEELKRKELENARIESQNRLQLFLLLAGLLVAIIIAVLLLRNNRHKEKINRQLSMQKKLVDEQKDKAESALKELELTQTQLIQSEKMASLGELTAGIAHEIQNPLNFITNFSEVSEELLNDMLLALEKEQREEVISITSTVIQNLGRIKHHGKRADAIVKGMLYHSRTGSGNKEPTDINALLDEYLRLTYHGLKARDRSFNAIMSSDFDKSIGEISVVPQEIGRVILNLLANAFYAVTEKKKLMENGYVPTISVSTKNLGKSVKILISDNGIGIPQKVLDKIFQPFFTTKPSGQGTGLGLSLSYEIITKGHGGKLTLKTNEGEGTEFTIILPQ